MELKVAIIGGGSSDEAEISRISSGEVLKAIQITHEAKFFEFDKNLATNLLDYGPDVAVPVLHGPHGEDGTIQGFLSGLEIPFVGSDIHASAIGMDKHVSKLVFEDNNLSVLPSFVLTDRDLQPCNIDQSIDQIHSELGASLVVKPVNQGSAIGVTLLPNGGDLKPALLEAAKYSREILIEPFKQGREITVGVLDLYDQEPTSLPVIDIVLAKDEWYDFTNRYTVGKSKHVIPPKGLSQELLDSIAEAAVKAHVALSCSDLSRSDFVVEDTGKYWLLEVNTMPGMTSTSLYPDAARANNIAFPTLMAQLVESGFKRGVR
ncbi:MAG: D-alanine--D-alanine ligase [Gammaproteobacteria bacterium]|nr:D-alanine--D-alanine ligase [Gammaproteobacteria bacterium]